jgi:hypothetical protein
MTQKREILHRGWKTSVGSIQYDSEAILSKASPGHTVIANDSTHDYLMERYAGDAKVSNDTKE